MKNILYVNATVRKESRTDELARYLLKGLQGEVTELKLEDENIELIYDTIENIGEKWMLNLICLKEGKSYIITKNQDVQRNLQTLFSGSFTNNIMKLDLNI